MAALQADPAQRLHAVIKTQADIARLGPDLGQVMALATERAQELTGAAGAVVELAEGEEMVYRAVSGIASGQLGLRLKRSNSLSGLCVRRGVPLRCDDSETDPSVDREACRRVGLRSMIVVPLEHEGKAVGALKVMAREPKGFKERDLETLALVSGMIASVMFHATHNEASALFHRATHDALTGLANRALFYDRLRQALAQAERAAAPVAVVILDMDGLKPVNDTLGHRAGDAAIREVAGRIKQGSRDTDTVARTGGDEFGAILTPIENRAGAQGRVDRIAARIAEPYVFEGKALALGASIGLALFPEDGRSIEALVEKADQAMYHVKRSRKTART